MQLGVSTVIHMADAADD